MFRRSFVKAIVAGLCGVFAPVNKAMANTFDPFKAQVKGKFTCGPVYYVTRSPMISNMIDIRSLYYDKSKPFIMPEGLRPVRVTDIIKTRIDADRIGDPTLPCLMWDSAEVMDKYEAEDNKRLEVWAKDVEARRLDVKNGVKFNSHENVDGTLCFMRSRGFLSSKQPVVAIS